MSEQNIFDMQHAAAQLACLNALSGRQVAGLEVCTFCVSFRIQPLFCRGQTKAEQLLSHPDGRVGLKLNVKAILASVAQGLVCPLGTDTNKVH